MIDQLDSLERPICSTRRKLLKAIGGFSALAALPNSSFAKLHDRKDQSLSLLNLHTGESIKSTFIANGDFQRSSLTELDYLLRDHRNDQIHQMDTSLLMLLHELQDKFMKATTDAIQRLAFVEGLVNDFNRQQKVA